MPNSKKSLRMKRTRKHRRNKKIMKGGQLSANDEQSLIQQGFSQIQINSLNTNNISMDSINQAINEYQTDPHQLIVIRAKQINDNNNLNVSGNSSNMDLLHDSDLDLDLNEPIQHNPEDIHNFNIDDNNDPDTSFESYGSMYFKLLNNYICKNKKYPTL